MTAVREGEPYDLVVVSVPATAEQQEMHAQLAALRRTSSRRVAIRAIALCVDYSFAGEFSRMRNLLNEEAARSASVFC